MYVYVERERERERERVVICIIYIMYREITVKETTDLKNIFNSRLYQFICVAKNTEGQTMCPPSYYLSAYGLMITHGFRCMEHDYIMYIMHIWER